LLKEQIFWPWMGMKWDRVCFCSWFDADEAYGWVGLE